MAFCINCGKDMEDKFCKICGGNVIGFDESFSMLLNKESIGINEIETKNIIKLWESVTKYSENKTHLGSNKFMTLENNDLIQKKIKGILEKSSNEILIVGTESLFKKILNVKFHIILNKITSEIRILSDQSEEHHIFGNSPKMIIKKLDQKNNENFGFIIKDGVEAILFMTGLKDNQKLVIWTDSKAFVTTLTSLFNILWQKSSNPDQLYVHPIPDGEASVEHRLKELEQKKIILNYLQNIFKLTEKEIINAKLI